MRTYRSHNRGGNSLTGGAGCLVVLGCGGRSTTIVETLPLVSAIPNKHGSVSTCQSRRIVTCKCTMLGEGWVGGGEGAHPRPLPSLPPVTKLRGLC